MARATHSDVAKLLCGDIGRRLAQARRKLELSGNALAKRAGLHHKTVQDIEMGVRSPTVETVERLANAMGIRPSWLAFGEGEMRQVG